jgi:hypothetical protein
MRCSAVLFCFLVLLATTTAAQDKIEVEDLAHHPFTAECPSTGQLNIHLRSAEVRIRGTDESRVSVQVAGKQGSSSNDVRARFRRSGKSCELRVTGGPHNDLTITIEVPRKSNLFLRVFAGDVEIRGITGDEDIELLAGELRIGIGDVADYAHVRASVTSGELDAPSFGESHGGLFRSFAKSGSGQYNLVAHVGAGQLTLQ